MEKTEARGPARGRLVRELAKGVWIWSTPAERSGDRAPALRGAASQWVAFPSRKPADAARAARRVVAPRFRAVTASALRALRRWRTESRMGVRGVLLLIRHKDFDRARPQYPACDAPWISCLKG